MRTTTKDGRTILTGRQYTFLREQVWLAQEKRCTCGARLSLAEMHLHHKDGRGGGRRDDTVETTVGLCWRCHDRKHRGPKPCPAK